MFWICVLCSVISPSSFLPAVMFVSFSLSFLFALVVTSSVLSCHSRLSYVLSTRFLRIFTRVSVMFPFFFLISELQDLSRSLSSPESHIHIIHHLFHELCIPSATVIPAPSVLIPPSTSSESPFSVPLSSSLGPPHLSSSKFSSISADVPNPGLANVYGVKKFVCGSRLECHGSESNGLL